MKNKLIKMTAALVALVGFSTCVQATAINGYIGFNGAYAGYTSAFPSTTTPGTADLSLDKWFALSTVSINAVATGNTPPNALFGASLVSFVSSVGVNGNAPALAGQQLWQVLVGTTVYSFTVGSVAQTLGAGNTTLTLAGSGILSDSISTSDNTAGTYTLAFGASGPSFTFASTSASNLPDGGATVLLLGAALSAIGLLRKKLIA